MASGLSGSVEQLQRLYYEKNEHLNNFFESVTPYEFYREIFPVGSFERKGHFEDTKGNAIAVTIPKKETGIALQIEGGGRAIRYTITDELDKLEEIRDTDFTIMSPISYFGKKRNAQNARYLYAMVFDLDGVGMPQLRDTLHQMEHDILPKATFVVNSGTGLHLYYVLTEPVPMYPSNQNYLKELKYSLTRQIWNRFTSTIQEPQMQGIMQGFRVVGSGSKFGRECPVVAYRLGGKVELDSLLEYVPDSNGERQRLQGIMRKGRLSLEEAKQKYPDWYERRIVQKERRGRWIVKRDLYDWWLHRIKDEIKVGHRFYGIMTLAIYAKKCGIDEAELREDAFALLNPYDQMSEEDINRFTKDDVVCALEMFNEDYVTFPRDDIAKISGLTMPVNKRNWRKQSQHLEFARGIRALKEKMGEPVSGGRPAAQEAVYRWRQQHPEGRKADCHRELGLDPKTIRKWWDTPEEGVGRDG
ncbi:MAG: hypothetical protein PHP26_03565 [Syntrophomonas sp.]|nr:hypothetical protein [Syntrophomonas sp.]